VRCWRKEGKNLISTPFIFVFFRADERRDDKCWAWVTPQKGKGHGTNSNLRRFPEEGKVVRQEKAAALSRITEKDRIPEAEGEKKKKKRRFSCLGCRNATGEKRGGDAFDRINKEEKGVIPNFPSSGLGQWGKRGRTFTPAVKERKGAYRLFC